MGELGKEKQMKNKTPTGNPSAFKIVSWFVAALAATSLNYSFQQVSRAEL
jgi:hypothetical protein